MPLLDVSDVLCDPLFAERDPVIRRRSAETVGSNGRSLRTVTETPLAAAVVIQVGGDVLRRLAEARQITGSITVYTTTDLTAGDATHDADVIVYGGREYTVSSVADWSSWGAGFIAAQCDLKPLSGG